MGKSRRSRVRFRRPGSTIVKNGKQANDDYAIDNATANMLQANPGMTRAVARKAAMDKLWLAVKAAMGIA